MHHIADDSTHSPSNSMSAPSPSSPSIDPFLEQQLQQELLGLFEVDSQRDLETYERVVQQLTPATWQDDIAQLYRAIHTIKGGAVTVHAELALRVATLLEDVLSDLRYLEAIPELSDGKLCTALQEAGELLAVALTNNDASSPQAEMLVERIEALRQQILSEHAQSWDAEAQLRQEFIRDGFDLVVLDLERVVLQLDPELVSVDQSAIDIATQVLTELEQIGQELVMPDAWGIVLEKAKVLLDDATSAQWATQWPLLFGQFKACVSAPDAGHSDAGYSDAGHSDAATTTPVASVEDAGQPEMVVDPESALLPDDSCLESLDLLSSLSQSLVDADLDSGLNSGLNSGLDSEPDSNLDAGETRPENFLPAESQAMASPVVHETSRPGTEDEKEETTDLNWLPNSVSSSPVLPKPETEVEPESEPVVASTSTSASPQVAATPPADTVYIPIPLERLEASANSVVETVLSARSVTDSYQSLQQQLRRILALAEDSTEFVTHLRQLQDDYAILDSIKGGVAQELGTPTPERYRKGYITINRLLEMNLRLSELGAEAEQVSRHTTEALQQLDSHLSDLKSNIEQNQLVPFKNLAFRARTIVRDLINRTQKSVDFTVEGESLEIDVAMLRQLEPALLHLLRNAFDHGLETPEERIAAGKDARGRLHLALQRRGHRLLLSLEDDGRGIDGQVISQRSQALGLPLTQSTTDQEILALLCQPGFSSRTQVNEFSGRGVGMDVVATQITRLGGVLDLKTQLGQGTTFTLSLPLPRLLEPCLLVEAGGARFALPASQIGMIQMVSELEFGSQPSSPLGEQQQAQAPAKWPAKWSVKTPQGDVNAFHLLSCWSVAGSQPPLRDTAIALQIPASDLSEGFYLMADKLMGQQELAIQPLPTPLISPAHTLGLGLQSNGQLLPILDCSHVGEYLQGVKQRTQDSSAVSASGLQSPGLQSSGAAASGLDDQPGAVVHILVVDDAALMRRRLAASLQVAGYQVTSCADGLEAWNWLCSNPAPALVITDIEMPYLDGFSLIKRCREADMNYPILVSSSRLAEEWSREADRVGATDFLTKGFSTMQLLEKVQALLQQTVQHS